MSRVVSIKQASKLTGLSSYALRKGAIEGRFPSTRAGGVENGKILFDLELLVQSFTTECWSNIKQPK